MSFRRPIPRTLGGAIAGLLAVVLVPSLILVGVAFLEARVEGHRAAGERVAALARIAQLAEQRLLTDTRQMLFTLARTPVISMGDGEACSATVCRVMQASIVYSNIGVATAQGDIFCSAQDMDGAVNIADRQYFRRSMASHDFGIGSYAQGRITGKAVIAFAYPMLNVRQNRVERMLFAALDVAWLTTRLCQAGLPAGVTAWLIDDGRTVLASLHDESWVGQVIAGSHLGATVQQADPGGEVVEIDDLDGIRRIYAIQTVWSTADTPELRVAVGVPVTGAMAPVHRHYATLLGALLLGALAVALAAAALARILILRPLNVLVAATRWLAAGDLGARASGPMPLAEFRHLAATFDRLAATLEEREREIAEHVASVERVGRRYAVLSGTNQAIVHATGEADLYARICDVAVRRGMRLVVWIVSLEPSGGETLLAWAASDAGWQRPEGGGVATGCRHAERLRGGKTVIAALGEGQDVAGVPFCEEAVRHGARHHIAIPFGRGGRPVAAVNAFAGDEPLWHSDTGLDLVREMAGDIAYALATFDKDAEIVRLAFHDALTGLPNRHRFEREADEVIASAALRGLIVPVVKIELSSLHRRIDRFGQDASDFVLRSLAGELTAAMPRERRWRAAATTSSR